MNKALRIGLIAAVTLLLLVLFLRNSDPRQVWRVLSSMSLPWFAAAILTNFSALLFRTARWKTILKAATPVDPPLYDTFLSTAVGFMSSAVLPVRAGDLIRPALVSRRTGIRFSSALGTVASERLLDTSVVLSMFVVFSMTGGRALRSSPATAGKALIIQSAAGVAGLALLALLVLAALLYFFRNAAASLQARIAARLPGRLRNGWDGFYLGLSSALEILGKPAVLARVLVFTGGIWLCLTGQFILVLYAVGRPLPYLASFLVTGMTILGIAIPTPGGIGGFHKAAQMALTNFYGFEVSTSVAVAVVFHIVGTAPVVLTGLALFIREGMSLRQLAGIRESIEE